MRETTAPEPPLRFAVALLLLMPSVANAALITWEFSGTVEARVEDASAAPGSAATLDSLGVVVGAAFSGEMVFDTSVLDGNSSPTQGNYVGAIVSIETQIGSLSVSESSVNAIVLRS